MFEGPDYCMDDLLGILAIEKILYDHTGSVTGETLSEGCLMEACYYALEDVAPSVSAETGDYDTYIQKFCFPGMEEFYRLCREYGRKNGVSFKNTPYVKEAVDFVNQEMNGIDSYSIGWSLFTPKKVTQKKWPCLAVFTDPEFYQPVQLVESLYNIRTFYMGGVKRLKAELEQQETKIISLPAIVPEAERNQAA